MPSTAEFSCYRHRFGLCEGSWNSAADATVMFISGGWRQIMARSRVSARHLHRSNSVDRSYRRAMLAVAAMAGLGLAGSKIARADGTFIGGEVSLTQTR